MASDVSFADNTIDRRSSQAFVLQLFGGNVGWRANKQSTVTTSTTEAELLALSQAAKESMFLTRLIDKLGVKLDEPTIRIQCDNQQTIRIVTKDVQTLRTSLRHVNIHNHWLREAVEAKRIHVEYTPTNEMIADGLTKCLTAQQHQHFVRQMRLFDVSARLTGVGAPLPDIEEIEALFQ